MRKLSEIETEVAKLARPDQAKLLQFLTDRLSESETQTKPCSELLKKWRARSSGLVEKLGGTNGYLDTIRGRDEDGR